MTEGQTPQGVRQIDVRIESTGRFVGIAAPIDLTGDELLELIAWMAGALRDTLNPPSPIIVLPSIQRPLV